MGGLWEGYDMEPRAYVHVSFRCLRVALLGLSLTAGRNTGANTRWHCYSRPVPLPVWRKSKRGALT